MYDCLTIGDIKLDTFVVIPEAILQCFLKNLPTCFLCLEYGEKIPVQTIDTQIAGSASNVAVGLSRMGRCAAIFSVMGLDAPYHLAQKQFKKEKVITTHIKSVAKMRSSFSVVINFKGERTMLVSHEPHEYPTIPKCKTKWFYVCEMGRKYVSLYQELIKATRIDHAQLAINPGPIQIAEKKKELFGLMKRSTLLFLNLGEAETLTGLQKDSNLRQILIAAWQLNQRTVIVTDGQNGAYGYNGKEMYFMPTFPGRRVEATGAGDSFASGVLGATMRRLPLHEALSWGSVNAASVISKVGPQDGLLSATEIRRRLKTHPKFKAQKL